MITIIRLVNFQVKLVFSSVYWPPKRCYIALGSKSVCDSKSAQANQGLTSLQIHFLACFGLHWWSCFCLSTLQVLCCICPCLSMLAFGQQLFQSSFELMWNRDQLLFDPSLQFVFLFACHALFGSGSAYLSAKPPMSLTCLFMHATIRLMKLALLFVKSVLGWPENMLTNQELLCF